MTDHEHQRTHYLRLVAEQLGRYLLQTFNLRQVVIQLMRTASTSTSTSEVESRAPSRTTSKRS